MSEGMVLLLLLAGGAGGGYAIGRTLPGRRALGGWMLWLPLPFVILAIMLALQTQTSATLNSQQASYNFSFGFVLVSMLMAPFWLGANLAGAIYGRRVHKAVSPPVVTRQQSPQAAAMAEAAARDGRPDWSRYDDPPVPTDELAERAHALARRLGDDPAKLPLFGMPQDGQGACVIRDKFEYVYAVLENGQPRSQYASAVADELLYAILRDRARAMAEERCAGQGENAVFAVQRDLLGSLDPRWARQLEYSAAYQRSQRGP